MTGEEKCLKTDTVKRQGCTQIREKGKEWGYLEKNVNIDHDNKKAKLISTKFDYKKDFKKGKEQTEGKI